ncbi:MAG: hypothetical protein HC866_24240 [Leptolyngbyaceae cyanobacterium RU_5_1]|nr:hypothetical protein [Leptolyngbyaceae cyanobacterium RU_5_1]
MTRRVAETSLSIAAIAAVFSLGLIPIALAANPSRSDRRTQPPAQQSQISKILRQGDYDSAIRHFQKAKAKLKDKCAIRGVDLSVAAAQATKKRFPVRKTKLQQEQAFQFYSQQFDRLAFADKLCGVQAQQPSNLSGRPTNSKPVSTTAKTIFQAILPKLYQRTKIPVRLPTYIPENGSPQMPSANLTSVSANNYAIILGTDPECVGEHFCRVGTITASKLSASAISLEKDYRQAARFINNSLITEERRSPDVMGPVTLARNLKGYFIPWILADDYTDAKITWDEAGVRYSVAIRRGDKESLIKMANSAIKPPMAPWLGRRSGE